jgi:CIC family chloride channel protein
MPIKLAREKMGTVAAAMTEIVCIVDHTAGVDEAIRTLSELRATGAPVMQGERIVGIVSQSDLLRVRGASTSIQEVMTETVYAVRPDDPLLLAVRLMVEQKIHRVLVVNDAGELYGILSAMDVMRVLAHGHAEDGNLEYLDLRKLAVTRALQPEDEG